MKLIKIFLIILLLSPFLFGENRGDVNLDGRISTGDVVALINYIFGSPSIPLPEVPLIDSLYLTWLAPGNSDWNTIAKHYIITEKELFGDSITRIVSEFDSDTNIVSGTQLYHQIFIHKDNKWYRYYLNFIGLDDMIYTEMDSIDIRSIKYEKITY